MNIRPPGTSTRLWRNIASSLVGVLVLLICFQSSVSAGKGLSEFVLPRYPESYRKARIEGWFLVEVSWRNGEAIVQFLEHEVTAPTGDVNDPVLMTREIRKALSRWKVESLGDVNIQLKITFQLSPRRARQPAYEIHIREKDNIPSDIVIIVDQQEIQR